MYIAVVSGLEVLEVVSNEAASLDAMAKHTEKHPDVGRIVTNAKVFSMYSAGEELEVKVFHPAIVSIVPKGKAVA